MSTQGDRAPDVLWQTGFNERNAEISPDGRWLVYEANDSGLFEVYVRTFPDVDSGRWQISTEGGVQPRWSPDGSELFYRAPGGGLMAVGVLAEATFVAGNPEVLFTGGNYAFQGPARTYDVAPDGQRFLLIKSDSGSDASTSASMVVVQNWHEELRRLVPAD